jgi:hypothetical protein
MSENQKPTLPTGILISGICHGHLHEEDNGYKNDYIIIEVGTRPNDLGQQQPIAERISLYGDNLQQHIERANSLKGKHVVMSVFRAPARADIRQAFMRNTPRRDSVLLAIN